MMLLQKREAMWCCVVAWQNAMLLLVSIFVWKLLMLVGFEHVLVDVVAAALHLALVGLEADLQHPVAEGVAVQALDGDQGLVVVSHCDKAEPLALIGLQITDHLDILHCSKGSKELPQNVLLCLRRQVVDEDAPARAVGSHPRQQRVARQQVTSQGGESEPGGWVQGSTQGSPGGLGGQVGSQGRNRLGIVTRVVGKLHCDWLCRTLGDGSIELSNCPFRFYSLVKSDKTNSF